MEKQFQDIINDALWAPTPDNMQNWSIRELGSNSFSIFLNEEVECHPLDENRYCFILSLGGFAEYLEIAASVRKVRADFELDIDTLSMKCTLTHDESVQASDLYNSLKLRRTNRFPFKKGETNPEILKAMVASGEGLSSAISVRSGKVTKSFVGYLKAVEVAFFGFFKGFLSTMKWVNFETNHNKMTGMNYQNLGIQPAEAKVLSFLVNKPGLFRFLLNLFMKHVLVLKSMGNIKSSEGFVLITSPEEGKKAYFDVGRQSIRVWLFLTKNGYQAQPLSLSSLSCLDRKQKNIPELVVKHLDLFTSGEKKLQQEFSYPQGHIPAWLLRYGKPKDESLKLTSSRKNLDEVSVA